MSDGGQVILQINQVVLNNKLINRISRNICFPMFTVPLTCVLFIPFFFIRLINNQVTVLFATVSKLIAYPILTVLMD